MQLSKLEDILENDGIVFLTYGGFITQPLIVAMTEALESESAKNELSMRAVNNILTIFIELSQNMMTYSKKLLEKDDSHDPKGIIIVGQGKEEGDYYVMSRNIVTSDDRDVIDARLKEISSMDKDTIKKQYRALRKSGKGKHEHGAGIGFYEIAKRCDAMSFDFADFSKDKYQFTFKAIIQGK